jgi:tRNA-2-methylthio-N6-dimethylallyladenosine synthase
LCDDDLFALNVFSIRAPAAPRPNTPAAIWDNQIPDDIKKERLQRINVLVKQHARERRSRLVDRTVEVLVEERNVKIPTQVMGRTRHGYITYFDGDIDKLRGELVDVKITSCQSFYLAGDAVE